MLTTQDAIQFFTLETTYTTNSCFLYCHHLDSWQPITGIRQRPREKESLGDRKYMEACLTDGIWLPFDPLIAAFGFWPNF